MNTLITLCAVAAITLVTCFSLVGRSDTALEPAVGSTSGFAVVELFTSEGCSSCPPADEALIALLGASQREGKAVFALGFHVDSWNRLGWKDPCHAAAWSERQRAYSARTGDNVYTPQCEVNGTRSFVGSDRSALEHHVNDVLAINAVNTLTASAERQGPSVRVRYTIGGDLSGKELIAAVTEAGLGTLVRAGENSGRRLQHAPVVHAVKALVLNEEGSTGEITIDAFEVKDPVNAQVVLLVQGRGQGAIFAACSAAIATH